MASALELGEQLDDSKLQSVYAGCRILAPISELLHIPIDQVNFLSCHALALFVAYPFRHVFHPCRTSLLLRHTIELSLGLMLVVFCFGSHCLHLLVQSSACYLILLLGPRRHAHVLVFLVAMSYLAGAHIYRQLYHYGSYTLDITGHLVYVEDTGDHPPNYRVEITAPMMVMTQKLTSLAFSLHDGTAKKLETLTPDQRKYMIRRMPSFVEFFSYMFYFHGVLCGPLSFYNDYVAFIDGSNFARPLQERLEAQKHKNADATAQNGATSPGTTSATAGDSYEQQLTTHRLAEAALERKIMNHVIRKLGVAMSCGLIILAFPTITPRRMTDPAFFDLSFGGKILTIGACMAITRQRYYLAWTLAEAVNHNAGLGFRGFDETGRDMWDQNENVNILNVEFSQNLKMTLDNWNIITTIWLRRLVYERVPYMKTLAVFTVSAVWHGFYPGYYLTFFTAAFLTIVARKARRVIRPYFQSSSAMARFYDVITMATTWLAINYLTAPFSILRLRASIKLLSAVYWYVHVLAVLLLLLLTYFHRRPPTQLDKNSNDPKRN